MHLQENIHVAREDLSRLHPWTNADVSKKMNIPYRGLLLQISLRSQISSRRRENQRPENVFF